MDQDTLSAVVAALGPEGVIRRVLCQDVLLPHEESFLIEHLDLLSGRELVSWAMHPEPDPEGAVKRPHGRIVERALASIADDSLLRLDLMRDVLARMKNREVAEELAEGMLRACRKFDPSPLWPILSGGSVFERVRTHDLTLRADRCAVRDHDVVLHGDKGCRPHWALAEGVPQTFLTDLLLEGRRHDASCLAVLVDAARERDPFGTYALWSLNHLDLLASTGDPTALLDADTTTLIETIEADRGVQLRTAVVLGVAASWARTDARAHGWLVERYLAAHRRGVAWGTLWAEIPAALRDAVALASLAGDDAAPWVLGAIDRAYAGVEAWNVAFAAMAKLETFDLHRHDFNLELRGHQALAVHGLRELNVGVQEIFREVHSPLAAEWIRTRPFPPSPDEAFARAFAESMERYAPLFAERLRELPLSRDRASLLVRKYLHRGLWGWDNWKEVVAASDPIPRELVTEPEHEVLKDPEAFAAWRRLGGARAEEILETSWRSTVEDERMSFWYACRLLELGAFADRDARITTLRDAIAKAPLRAIVETWENHGWLISDADLQALAEAKATTTERWAERFGGVKLPAILDDAIEKHVPHAGADEVGDLLDHLEARGRSRRQVLGLAMRWIADRKLAPEVMRWIAPKLDSKELWKTSGRDLVRMLLASPTIESANVLFDVFYECLTRRPEVEPPPTTKTNDARKTRPSAPFISVMHEALGAELITIADQSLRSNDVSMAGRALRALAHLSPPSRLHQSVRGLRKLPGAESVAVLIEANERLIRRAETLDVGDFDALGLALGTLVSRHEPEEVAS